MVSAPCLFLHALLLADLLPPALQKGEVIQPRYFDEGEIRDIKRRSWMPSFGRKTDNTWHAGDPLF